MGALPQLRGPAGAFSRFALGGVFALSLGASPPEVTAVRFWSHGEATRVVVETSGEFHHVSDRLHNPERLFFDLRGAGWTQSRKVHVIPVNDGLVKQIRVAETRPETTRIVLDLEGDAEAAASHLANPERLVIEVRRAGTSPARVLPPPPVSRVTAPEPAGKAFRPPVPPPARQPFVLVPPSTRVGRRAPRLSLRLSAATAAALEPHAPRPPDFPVEEASVKAPPKPKTEAKAVTAAAVEPVAGPPAIRSAEALVKAPPKPTMEAKAAAPAPVTEKAVPARTNAVTGERSMTRVLGLKVGRVVIDPGHGGHDTGSIGPGGLMEKNLVLDVSRRLGALLEQKLGSQVFYTRADDTFVPLEERTAYANDKRADLFVSVHANSSPLRATAGSEVFYLNFTTSKSDLEVAARENASSQKSVYELHDLLQKIALRDKVDESRDFAARVQKELFALSARGNSKARNRGVKKAPFVVLIGASMPSVLVEIGFISNPREEGLMNRAEHRQKIADALFRGVSQYSGTLSHFQVAQRNPVP